MDIRKATFSGRIRNKSARSINKLTLRIRLFEVKPDTISIGEEKMLLSIDSQGQLENIPSSTRKAELQPTDSESLSWESYSGVPPGETQSF